ncbi:response regulator transcription factor [Microgenomates group bacterium]|nr:response regulator transcription factor [Microgenomates group bacterium]
MARILVVEDNLPLAQTLVSLLTRFHEVYSAQSVREAKRKAQINTFDLVLLDRQLPDGDGLELISYFADNCNHSLRTLILSDLGQTKERIEGLEEGSDDYLAKPFSLEELSLRVQGLLSKDKRLPNSTLRCGVLTYDVETRHLSIKNRLAVILTKRVGSLMEQFMRYPNHILTRESLIRAIYDDNYGPSSRDPKSIDVLVSRLKKTTTRIFVIRE